MMYAKYSEEEQEVRRRRGNTIKLDIKFILIIKRIEICMIECRRLLRFSSSILSQV